MKFSEFIISYKVPLGFAIVAIIAALFALGLYFNVLNSKNYYLKFYGVVLTAASTLLVGLIFFVFDKGTSTKSDEILNNTTDTKGHVKIIDLKTDMSIEKLGQLQSENIDLRNEVITLQNDQIRKNREILELNNKIFQQNKEALDLTTGGSSYPSLRHCQITLFDNTDPVLGSKLHVSFEIHNKGDYPLDNIRIRGYQVKDFRKVDPIFLWTQLSTSGLNMRNRFPNIIQGFPNGFNIQIPPVISSDYDVFKAQQREFLGIIPFKEYFEYYGINLFVESKRQDWIILVRLYRPIQSNEPFAFQAQKIMKVTPTGLENITEEIDAGFPVSNENKFIWFNSELPKQWFSATR